MDDTKYAVAEYENQQNHAKNLKKTTSFEYSHQKGGGGEAAALLLVQILVWCRFLGFLQDFVDFHIPQRHI